MNLVLRRLRYFVTVAEELSFVRAATSGLQRRPTIEETLERVALGEGIVVLPAGIAGFYRHPGISYVGVLGVPPA